MALSFTLLETCGNNQVTSKHLEKEDSSPYLHWKKSGGEKKEKYTTTRALLASQFEFYVVFFCNLMLQYPRCGDKFINI